MEQMHEERKQAAVDLLEDKYEKRIALMSRIQQQTEAAKHTLEIENIALKVRQNTQYFQMATDVSFEDEARRHAQRSHRPFDSRKH
jgi:hypothetical protein